MEEKKKDDISFGIGVAMSFILTGIFIYMNDEYLGHKNISIVVSMLLITFGVIGLGTQLNKISKGKKDLGFDNLGIGLGFGFLWALLHTQFPYIWMNWILLIVLFAALAGIMAGVAKIIENIILMGKGKNLIVGIPIVITQIGTTIIVIHEIITQLEII